MGITTFIIKIIIFMSGTHLQRMKIFKNMNLIDHHLLKLNALIKISLY